MYSYTPATRNIASFARSDLSSYDTYILRRAIITTNWRERASHL